MRPSKAQLCDRARQWASLRLDGELSELEAALLDAHLARCVSCQTFADDATGIAGRLRETAPELPESAIVVPFPRRGARARMLYAGLAAALVLVAAALGAALNLVSGSSSSAGPAAAKPTAMLAFVDTPDQLRKLRRPILVETGKPPTIPRNRALPGETV
jgi:predicted anti-sigma-YlaC factor YlaD